MTRDPTDSARFLAAHAKRFGAGAFGAPTAKDIASGNVRVDDHGDGNDRCAIAWRRLTRPSRRRAFDGRAATFPSGARVALHVATPRAGTVPPLDAFDVVVGYVEDPALAEAVAARPRILTQISAASEIIGVWGRDGDAPLPIDPADRVTVARWDAPDLTLVDAAMFEARRAEIDWHDDYPFYSDGSWGATSLRGFDPDPRWGVKPSEMSRRWLADNPGALDRECVWTSLAHQCPTLVELTEAVAGSAELERVRLLRMASPPSGRMAHLSRHTDITDKAAGTRDGKIARLHVPLVTSSQVSMTTWDLGGARTDHHLDVGGVWYLDARKPHAVTSRATVDRIHLVVDLVASSELRDRIVEAETC